MQLKNIITLLILTTSCSHNNIKTPKIRINQAKYIGKWNTIVNTDNNFEKRCNNNIYEEYIPLEDKKERIKRNKMKVLHSCNEDERTLGIAKFSRKNPNKVNIIYDKLSFTMYTYPEAAPVINKKNAYIFYINQNYTTALIGTKDREHFWIISRTTSLQKETIDNLLKKANDFGFQIEKAKYIKHEQN